MTIPVPPSEVQRDLVDRMAKFDDAIEAQRTLLNSLVALRGAEIELSMNELTDPAVHA
jgi:restriction endonuclease S subunit